MILGFYKEIKEALNGFEIPFKIALEHADSMKEGNLVQTPIALLDIKPLTFSLSNPRAIQAEAGCTMKLVTKALDPNNTTLQDKALEIHEKIDRFILKTLNGLDGQHFNGIQLEGYKLTIDPKGYLISEINFKTLIVTANRNSPQHTTP